MPREIKLTQLQKQTIERENEVKALSMLLDAFLLVKGNDFAVTRLCEYATSLAKTALSAMFIEDGYKMIYEVTVGNIGTVYRGENEELAEENYQDYVELAELGSGRASGEPVTFFVDGEIQKESEFENMLED